MSFFGTWELKVRPVICKMISIIPHIREMMNIAFKPVNGLDLLEQPDKENLERRIASIDEKFSFITAEQSRSRILGRKQRGELIRYYNDLLRRLENQIVTDLVCPVIKTLISKGELYIDSDYNPFVSFYMKELEHSVQLAELNIFENPLKASLIRKMESGIDFLLSIHPRCYDYMHLTMGQFYLKVKYSKAEEKSFLINIPGVHGAEILLKVTAAVCSAMELNNYAFRTQFRGFGVQDTFALTTLFCLSELCQRSKSTGVLSLILDRLIIECSIILRLYTNTEVMNDVIKDTLYSVSDEDKILPGHVRIASESSTDLVTHELDSELRYL